MPSQSSKPLLLYKCRNFHGKNTNIVPLETKRGEIQTLKPSEKTWLPKLDIFMYPLRLLSTKDVNKLSILRSVYILEKCSLLLMNRREFLVEVEEAPRVSCFFLIQSDNLLSQRRVR